MNYDDFFNSLETGEKWETGVSFKRLNPLPIDSSSVIKSSQLSAYLSSAVVYPGQIISVYDEDTGKMSFHGISLNSDGEIELLPLDSGNGNSLNSVQKIVISNGSDSESGTSFAFKNCITKDGAFDKSNKLTSLESDASYVLDLAWKVEYEKTHEVDVFSLEIDMVNGETYHNIVFPSDIALAPVFKSTDETITYSFRDSYLTFLLTGAQTRQWSNINTFRSSVFFVPDRSDLVSNFWKGTTHVHKMSKIVYDYGTSENTIENGTLEIYESEIHLYGGDSVNYPRPTLSIEAGQSGKIYLHNSTAITIPDDLEASIEIIICPENNRADAVEGYAGQKGIRVYKGSQLVVDKDYKTYYTIGGISASMTSPKILLEQGKTYAECIDSIFAPTKQPDKVDPSITLTISPSSGSGELGSNLPVISTSVSTTAGSYSYGPATGVIWNDDQTITTSGNSSGKFGGGNRTYSVSRSYRAATTIARDNKGNLSSPVVRISAGSDTDSKTFQETVLYRYFYGNVSGSDVSTILANLRNVKSDTDSLKTSLSKMTSVKITLFGSGYIYFVSKDPITAASQGPLPVPFEEISESSSFTNSFGASYDVHVYRTNELVAGEYQITLSY